MEDRESPDDCVTFHPEFHPAYVLQIAKYQYRQQYNETIQDSAE